MSEQVDLDYLNNATMSVRFESEFLAHIVLPDGSSAGDWMKPQIAMAYETGEMPSMFPALGDGR